MELFFFWIILGVIVAIIAGSKGRNWFGWFVYGFLLAPIALVHVLVVRRSEEADERRAVAGGRIPCPHCAEMIKAQAKVCPFCRRDVGQVDQHGSSGSAKAAPPGVKSDV